MSDIQNIVVNPTETPVEQDESDNQSDNQSASSVVSAARVLQICPECGKEMQTRHLFNHVRKLHPDYFACLYTVWSEAEFKNLIDDKAPLPFEYSIKNDFDEKETKQFFGCLACNNTFTVEKKACLHVSKKKCTKLHVAGLKELWKREEKLQKEKLKHMTEARRKIFNRTNQDIYNDTHNMLVIIKNKIFDEYLPYFASLREGKHALSIEPLPTIVNNNKKDFLQNQERRIQRYFDKVMREVSNHLNDIPLDLVSDDLYLKLKQYRNLMSHVKLSTDNNRPAVLHPDYPNQEWGYIATPISLSNSFAPIPPCPAKSVMDILPKTFVFEEIPGEKTNDDKRVYNTTIVSTFKDIIINALSKNTIQKKDPETFDREVDTFLDRFMYSVRLNFDSDPCHEFIQFCRKNRTPWEDEEGDFYDYCSNKYYSQSNLWV